MINVVIWAGISWITIAQQLAENWEEVLIIEKRNHIWWNCYDFYDENWILVQKYWPHIFHTDSDEVWNYLSNFTDFTNYQHKVLWYIEGKFVPIPFNLNSLYKSFPSKQAKSLEKLLYETFGDEKLITIQSIREKSEKNIELQILANYIYEKVFLNYTKKQWGINESKINQEVLNRVPIVISRDNSYFPYQKYQWLPKGWYTKMFENMLNNKLIKVMLNCNYKDNIKNIKYKKLFITSPIDEFFDFKYWKLWYRKTLFKMETLNIKSFQDVAVVNYPNDYEWTRITEMKKFYPNLDTYNIKKSIIMKEIPWKWKIECYPIRTAENLNILSKYIKESNKLKNVFFLWRLACYEYLDMDKVVKNVLDFFKK